MLTSHKHPDKHTHIDTRTHLTTQHIYQSKFHFSRSCLHQHFNDYRSIGSSGSQSITIWKSQENSGSWESGLTIPRTLPVVRSRSGVWVAKRFYSTIYEGLTSSWDSNPCFNIL